MEQASAKRVLIIDDNEDSADTLSMLLETLGFTTSTAYDGRQGLTLAREFQPDAVLLDIGLPDIDGYALGQMLRAEMPGARIIAVSGYGRAQDQQRSREVGFFDHLVKPLDIQVLTRTLGR